MLLNDLSGSGCLDMKYWGGLSCLNDLVYVSERQSGHLKFLPNPIDGDDSAAKRFFQVEALPQVPLNFPQRQGNFQ